MNKALLLLAALTASIPVPAQTTPSAPLVAAAASVRFALEELLVAFHEETGHSLRLSPGSSGNLARQIREGAPYELYLAAAPRYVEDLSRDGLTRDRGKDYLLGRLAIVVPIGSTLVADGSLEDLRAALMAQRVRRFSIANPEHAPYGERAEQALRHVGLWEAIRGRLVFGENVGQAAQFAISGNADGGIIGLALARTQAVAKRSSAKVIPQDWHAPLRHRAVLLNDAGPIAEQFYAYLSSSAAREVFRRHGFGLPAIPD